MSNTANIVEIFSSRQGEGTLVGTQMTFVRFAFCNLGCRWCDTYEASKFHEICRIECPSGSEKFIEKPNPISVVQLNDLLTGYEDEYISVTGGEPLLQTAFLAEWLPTITLKRKILLETCGVYYEQFAEIVPHVQVVSMDIKLPSSTGLRPFWQEHEEFLRIALIHHKDIYVKIVVCPQTKDQDLQEAIRLISRTNRHIPVIIQPASPTLTFHETVSPTQLDSLNRLFSAYLPNVQVIPQMHKEWAIL
ncbi:MAG: 7-carboxy-7-deazaguanine synthase QueE [Pseudomonadota bacterium]